VSGKPKNESSRRIAAIDIGSNSIHLIVVEARSGQLFRIIEREKEMVRLAAGTLQTNHIAPSRMDAAIAALQRFSTLAQALNACPILVSATSAVREAWNRDVFLDRVARETGLTVEIIPGVEEARLIALAVSEATDFHGEPSLIVDIGGGSTEFILTSGKTPNYLASIKLGAVRLHERFLAKSDPPSRPDIEALNTYVKSGLLRTVREVRQAGPFRSVIGTSGTILGLAAALQPTGGLEGKGGDYSFFSAKLSLSNLATLNKRLQTLSLRERRKLPGVDARRADILLAGGALLETVMREMDISELSTCDWSLREGMILNYLHEHAPEFLAHPAPTSGEPTADANWRNLTGVRPRSILSLARRYEYEELHSHHTARLAVRLFDELKSLHRLGPLERELLQYAALLHDIGYHIAHGSHHKHGMYLIRHAELPGFHAYEIAIIANLVRYHRGSPPKRKHEDFMRLSAPHQEVVQKLMAILRVADALDRRHQGVVEDIKVRTRSARITISPVSAVPCDLEVWCAEKAAETFCAVFPVALEFRPVQSRELSKRAAVS
jgi:exopolyphosphatase / guanosine-5'-triphosphate,3'-diphosphate pyrophosphatase